MKSYWDLPQKERLEISEEELLNTWMPKEAATQGILEPREPEYLTEPPKPDVPELKTHTVFKVEYDLSGDGYSNGTFDPIFMTIGAAEAFIRSKPAWLNYLGANDYCAARYSISQPMSYKIVTETVVDKKEAEANEAALREYIQVHNQNKSARTKYESDIRVFLDAASKARNDWMNLRAHKHKLQEVIDNLEDFVDLAEGDVNMAIRFMCKKADTQLVYDALNEIPHDYTWEVTTAFGDVCLQEDLNPYRKIGKSLF